VNFINILYNPMVPSSTPLADCRQFTFLSPTSAHAFQSILFCSKKERFHVYNNEIRNQQKWNGKRCKLCITYKLTGRMYIIEIQMGLEQFWWKGISCSFPFPNNDPSSSNHILYGYLRPSKNYNYCSLIFIFILLLFRLFRSEVVFLFSYFCTLFFSILSLS